MQTKLKILSLQWQRKWLKPSPWHLQPNVLSAVYASGVQPVICQVFFIFFIKSQLLLAFYIVAVRVSFRSSASRRRWVQRFRLEAALLLDLLLKGGSISLDRISCVACSYSRVCRTNLLSMVHQWVWVLTAEIWDIAAARCPLASSWQTRRQRMPTVDRVGLNWWPHPAPLPVYLCRGRARVTAGEYLAGLNKLRFACWVMENQRWRLVLPLTDVWAASVVFHENVFPNCWPLSAFFFFKLSSLFLQFLRALRISFPVFASHPVKRVWRASLFVWNHGCKGSWHVQVD